MNEQNLLDSNNLALTDELVSRYLQDNPEFFNRNAALLSSIKLIDHQRGTVSLVERQQQKLRENVYALQEEITQLMTVAQHNERLFILYSDIYLRLIDCTCAAQLLDCLHQATTDLLSFSCLKLWLIPELGFEHENVVTNDCGGIIQNRLDKEDYYFGRLQKRELELIFSKSVSGSVALIKLVHNDSELGFLAISSEDAEHFDPRMDTLLLSQFRRLVAKLLQQLLV
jgi:uncharacterized protein YigA (DUF484 family)